MQIGAHELSGTVGQRVISQKAVRILTRLRTGSIRSNWLYDTKQHRLRKSENMALRKTFWPRTKKVNGQRNYTIEWFVIISPRQIFPILSRCGPTRAITSSFIRFLDHTQRRTTIGRTPLDEWSARCRDLYLTTHNTHDRHPWSRRDSSP